MSLFDKKRDYSTGAPLYSLGANKTYLVIGLGNVGEQYQNTRHNIGFEVLDNFAKINGFPDWLNKKDLRSAVSVHTINGTRVILAKPTTLMNLSGEAASAIQRFYRIYNQNIVVVHDELAIAFGSLRTRVGGSDAGHNGVRSLIQHIGDDFGRLRIGIGSELSQKSNSVDYVLRKFSKTESDGLELIIKEAGAMLTEYLVNGELPHDTRTVL